jgi:Leucine-rich repeat (LRR) protein
MIYFINDEDYSQKKNANISMDNANNEGWWTQVELQKLILASNKIKTIDKEIKNLPKLTILDVIINLILFLIV